MGEIEIAAVAYSLRKLAETFLPGFAGALPLPELTMPFDPAREVAVVRQQLQALCRAARVEDLIAFRDKASAPAAAGLPSRLRSEEVRFWSGVLVERGAAKPPINKPRKEDLDIQAGALRMVIAAFMLNVPDQLLIDANRATYTQYQEMDETDDDPTARSFRLSMRIYMEFLGAFMDSSGVTARYQARAANATGSETEGDVEPISDADRADHREALVRAAYNGALRLWRCADGPDTPALPDPFDAAETVAITRDVLEGLMQHRAPRDNISHMAETSEGEMAKFYRRVVARKDGAPTRRDRPRFEDPLDEASMLQAIVGVTLSTMPDQVIIDFNRAAWAGRQAIAASGQDVTVEERALALEMTFYEAMMDRIGVTERFTAQLNKGQAH